jgi:hypothetical protein
MATEESVVELLGAGIVALARADAVKLEDLAEAARYAGRPGTLAEQCMARDQLQTLGSLIVLTRRNLRLLRGAAGYGPPGH